MSADQQLMAALLAGDTLTTAQQATVDANRQWMAANRLPVTGQ